VPEYLQVVEVQKLAGAVPVTPSALAPSPDTLHGA
jgi:hypothetical protein